ncbi:P-loop containing nucleoside triphosphate hydrolase protein [Leucosporidium creatinivorum]|uniref:Guanylate kinase n=1 Tax=Leucosporidium creatinivorum TaxID=106004 RepID=A0A1Y2G4E8_9BASI|nr:P-loop containing nucleoside triphosphate hydrolase protein [Leucosporidium creatinivorum]
MSLAALRPIVICGPSGTGKSTLLKKLFDDFPGKFGFSISHTTRAPRPGEENGVSYHFTTRESFLDLVKADGFIEHAEFSGNMYGTSVKAVEDVAKDGGKKCILDIDTQGVKLIKQHHPHLNPVYVFIAPPSLASLRTRLTGRGTETDSSLSARLAAAIGEVEYAKTGAFDVVVVNDDLERAYGVLKGIVVENKTEGDKLPAFEE